MDGCAMIVQCRKARDMFHQVCAQCNKKRPSNLTTPGQPLSVPSWCPFCNRSTTGRFGVALSIQVVLEHELVSVMVFDESVLRPLLGCSLAQFMDLADRWPDVWPAFESHIMGVCCFLTLKPARTWRTIAHVNTTNPNGPSGATATTTTTTTTTTAAAAAAAAATPSVHAEAVTPSNFFSLTKDPVVKHLEPLSSAFAPFYAIHKQLQHSWTGTQSVTTTTAAAAAGLGSSSFAFGSLPSDTLQTPCASAHSASPVCATMAAPPQPWSRSLARPAFPVKFVLSTLQEQVQTHCARRTGEKGKGKRKRNATKRARE